MLPAQIVIIVSTYCREIYICQPTRDALDHNFDLPLFSIEMQLSSIDVRISLTEMRATFINRGTNFFDRDSCTFLQ